jgi:hypothetical protein
MYGEFPAFVLLAGAVLGVCAVGGISALEDAAALDQYKKRLDDQEGRLDDLESRKKFPERLASARPLHLVFRSVSWSPFGVL